MKPANGSHWCFLCTEGSINSRRRRQLSTNLILSTCFGMQRYGPHRVVTCRFLCHVSMYRYRVLLCHSPMLAQALVVAAVNTPTVHSRWKTPCHVTTSDTLVPMLRVSHRYTRGSRSNMRCKMAALLLHDQQVLAHLTIWGFSWFSSTPTDNFHGIWARIESCALCSKHYPIN